MSLCRPQSPPSHLEIAGNRCMPSSDHWCMAADLDYGSILDLSLNRLSSLFTPILCDLHALFLPNTVLPRIHPTPPPTRSPDISHGTPPCPTGLRITSFPSFMNSNLIPQIVRRVSPPLQPLRLMPRLLMALTDSHLSCLALTGFRCIRTIGTDSGGSLAKAGTKLHARPMFLV